MELHGTKDELKCIPIPRTNIIPQLGIFYKNYSEEKDPVKYRELPEFGKYILEFNGSEPLGRINKIVPHVLMKKFTQSCWSELCEIYGIPPRVMKTNTRDTNMMGRAKTMMQQMAAAWFIIDNNESAQDILWQLVQADMEKVEQQWNSVVIPALQKIGW